MDFYFVLGVLPDAEHVVVVAAYRALAQRYHPDKWRGDAAEAHQRMARINAAYEVLADPTRRAAYDATRSTAGQSTYETQGDEDQAFDSALRQTEDHWDIATRVYPDIVDHRRQLTRISTTLSFAYVTTLLETKQFAHRKKIAEGLERAFLERYFGTNDALVAYAKQLILAGKRDAAKALNAIVDVVGSQADAKVVVEQINAQFGLAKFWQEQAIEGKIVRLRQRLMNDPTYAAACAVAKALGYRVDEVGQGFFHPFGVRLTTPVGATQTFNERGMFVAWAKQNLCADCESEA